MRYFLTAFFFFLIQANAIKAQLIELPSNAAKLIGKEVYGQIEKSLDATKNKDTLIECAFIIKVQIDWTRNQKAKIRQVNQINVHNKSNLVLNDLTFLDDLDFIKITKSKKIFFINIPVYYSLINKTYLGSEVINPYYNFWIYFNQMFIRRQIKGNEIITMPITIFGAIYE